MSFSDLLNNIANAATGIGQALGLIPSNSNPNYLADPPIVYPIDSDTKARWLDFPDDRYVFGVIKEGDDLNYQTKGAAAIQKITSLFSGSDGDASGQFSDFALPITPQEIQQTENFAKTIRPTQGGTVVNHSGNRYKDLIISGTTGVAPFRGATGVNATTGLAFAQPDDLKFRSGYEVFIHFRNWLKSYEQAKLDPSNNTLRMIFKNYKDWEFLVVEPQKFTMKRDASRPLLYNYSIQFRVLAHYNVPKVDSSFLDTIDNAINKVTAGIETAKGIFLQTQSVIRSAASEIDSLDDDLRQVNLAVKAAQGIKLTASDMSNRIENDFMSQKDALNLLNKMAQKVSSLSNPGVIRALEKSGIDLSSINLPDSPEKTAKKQRDIARGIGGSGDPKQDFQNAKSQLGDINSILSIEDYPQAAQQALLNEQIEAAIISRNQVNNILGLAMSVRDKFVESINLGDATYDEIFDITPVTNISEPTNSQDVQFEILYAFYLAIQALQTLLSNDNFFNTAAQLFSQNDSRSNYKNLGQGIFSFPDPNAGIKEGIVPYGASIQDIALAELGDVNRWTELAELNNLKYPYIDSTGNSGSKINYYVKTSGFNDPTLLQYVSVGFQYIIPSSPTPTGAWAGKALFIATYQGGSVSASTSWQFIYPETGTVSQVYDINKYLQFTGSSWIAISIAEINSGEVLLPGDLIKIPIAKRPAPETINRGPADNLVTNGLSASEAALGVDLRLAPSGDLILGPNGDLQLSYGTANGAQAIALKLSYERGEVKNHPELGTRLQIGGKIQSLAAIRTQITTTLLQDGRIDSVKNIVLKQNGSSIYVTMLVFFKGAQNPIPVTIPL